MQRSSTTWRIDWRGSDELEALAQIVANWDNLRTAWRRAVEHRNIGALYQMADSLQWAAEVRGWHYQALDAFSLAADTLQTQGDPAESIESTYALVRLLCCQARQTFALGRLREAESFCRQGMSSLDDLPAAHRQHLDATLHLILSRVLVDMRRSDEARTAAETALAIFGKLEDGYGTAWTAYTLGIAIHEDGDNPKASVFFQQAISTSEEIGSQRIASYGLGMMASIYFLQGDYEQALDYSRRSLEIRQRFGDWRGIAYCLQEQGVIAGETGNLTQFETLLRQALTIAEDIGEQILQRGIMWCLGRGLYNAGKLDESLRVYRRGLALALQESEYVAGRAWFQAGLALPLHSLGAREEARSNINSALNTFMTVSAPYEAMDSLMVAGKILTDDGQIEKAAQLLGFVEYSPIEMRFLQQWAHDLSAKLPLSSAQRQSALNAGRAMSLHEALAFALS